MELVPRGSATLAVRINVEGTQHPRRRTTQSGAQVVYTIMLAVNSDTEERAVDETYRFTVGHRSAYDRTMVEAHDDA